MMKKILTFFCGFCALLYINGCNSTASGYSELSDDEKDYLIEYARTTVLQNQRLLSPEEISYIRNNVPRLAIRYYEDKTGEATVSWDTPKRTIRATTLGDLESERMVMRLVIPRNEIEGAKAAE